MQLAQDVFGTRGDERGTHHRDGVGACQQAGSRARRIDSAEGHEAECGRETARIFQGPDPARRPFLRHLEDGAHDGCIEPGSHGLEHVLVVVRYA